MFKYKLIGDNDYIFDVVGTLSSNRGVDDLTEYLSLNKSNTSSWKVYKNINQAVLTIANHIKKGSNIHIVVDSDADGYTSAAIIYEYLKLQNDSINITYHIHDKKVHGIKGVKIPEDTNLLIIPDASSNESVEHERISDMGVDIVVIDHHDIETNDVTPAIVVNPRLDGIGNTNLSGAGVVYKVCQGLDNHFNTDYADYFLDLVAVGCIGDIMSMKDKEVRYYVNEGLDNVNNQFLLSLINKQSYSMKGELNPTTIGFYVTPLINSVTRIGTLEDRIDMFKAFIGHKELVKYKPRGQDKEILVPFVDDMARRCANIKGKQDRSRDKNIKSILDSITINETDKVLIVKDLNIDGGTSGLIANNLASKYMKPVIIFGTKKDDMLKGSARSCKSFNQFKETVLNTKKFELAAGHESAFGVEIKENNFEEAISSLNELLKDETFEMVYDVDFVIPLKSLSKRILKDITDLSGVWGKDISEPLLVIEDIYTDEIELKVVGKKEDTINFTYNKITFVAFKQSRENIEALLSSNSFSVVGKTVVNDYNGYKNYQVIINDFNIR